ncbi:hypothetical protein C9374_013027 [Naegleria lovaniensis]|uniref:Alpha-mannosidase n=1 Tax=Naegleria lovaniensis TaxID=51637 RepID=A0AA88KB89_NAELO|nr:uncharacterized protein C9374_013027 [Naegleria lovaniensis]KAG2372905.1 hypothetical protein C9374_013027 [Naegleria lovaniensis]
MSDDSGLQTRSSFTKSMNTSSADRNDNMQKQYTNGFGFGNRLIGIILVVVLFCCIFTREGVIGASSQLRVFIIPHSHIDQGWLRTVREYQSETFLILDSIIEQLIARPHAKFVWGDVLYFKEWFEQQPATRQQLVKKMIKQNRFEFVGGGWIQTDEACASYTSIINSMTVGHEYLLRRFGIRPRVAWQIDPFGHDGRIPQIFSQMGFDALVINRVHFSIKSVMKNERALEFIWNISDNKTIFTEVLHTHYSSPRNFDFEKPGAEQINDQNVERKSMEFIEDMRRRAQNYRTNFIFVPFGDDFKFRNAHAQYSSMDRIINYINSHDLGMKVQYSTATEYFEELFKSYGSTTKFPVVKQDFVPYADYPDSYWTGYFTSLPNLKRSARTAESILTTTEMLYALARVKMTHQKTAFNWVDTYNSIQRSRQTVSLVQHHDSITGTCRQHVYNDYMSQLASAIQDMRSLHKSLAKHVLEISSDKVLFESLEVSDRKPHTIVIYNSLSHAVKQIITVNTKCTNAKVQDSSRQKIDYQVIPNVHNPQEEASAFPYTIQFLASIDGLAFEKISFQCQEDTEGDLLDTNVLYVNSPNQNHYSKFEKANVQVKSMDSARSGDLTIENDFYVVSIDKNTGYVNKVITKHDGKEHITSNQFLEYKTQNSGSYLFRPNDEGPSPLGQQSLSFVYVSKGNVMDKIFVDTKRVKIYITLPHNMKDSVLEKFIDYRFELSPLPENSETVARFGVGTKKVKGNLIVYDGFNFVKRVIHPAAPHPGHFYPSTSGAVLKMADSQQVSILTDHTMGVTAQDNEVEFLVHRRLMKDDMRGMSEANNDQSPLKFRLSVSYLIGTSNDDFVSMHKKSLLVNRQPQSYMVDGEVLGSFNIFNKNFPTNAEILSLQTRGISSDEVSIRFINLHPSKKVEINFSNLFSEGIEVSDIRERSLNLIYDVQEERKKLRFKQDSVMRFDFTKEVTLSGEGGQNTDQEGVFLSDEAIAEMNKNPAQRKTLALTSVDPVFRVIVPGSSIKSYFVAMTFSGKGFVPISQKEAENEDSEGKEINELGLEEEEEDEVNSKKEDGDVKESSKKEDDLRSEDKSNIDIVQENEVENKQGPKDHGVATPKSAAPFWIFPIFALVLSFFGCVCLSLILRLSRRKKQPSTILPMFQTDANPGVKNV